MNKRCTKIIIYTLSLALLLSAAVMAQGQVSRVGVWTTGLTHDVGAGDARLLIFAVGFEHSSILAGPSAVTYGGQPMTLIVSDSASSSNNYIAGSQLWYLDETGISSAVGNTFVPTWPSGTPAEPYYSAVTYQNVDQSSPVGDFSSTAVDGPTNPVTTTLSVEANGLSVATVACGNSGSYAWNNGWIEGADQSAASSSSSTADNEETLTGTSTASAFKEGSSPNRTVLAAAFLNYGSAPNEAPVLAPIGPKSVDENQNLNFGVSATDAEDPSPSLDAANLPTGATFVDNGDGTGTFDWTPDYTQSGTYYVTFTATDDSLATDFEVVEITVNNVNRAPVLATIGSKSTVEMTNLNFGVSASDPDGTTPTLSAVNVPSGASFVDNGDGSGAFDWTPGYPDAGDYYVTFIASDGALADSEIVTITVIEAGNQAPVLASIGSQSTTETVNLNFGVSATDPDATTPALSAVDVPSGASFTDHGDGTGTFDWTPGFTDAGDHLVTFIASDGSLADSEIVTITVIDVGNQTPVLASIGPKSVDEGQNLNFGVSASDPDGTIPALTTSALPANAAFSDNGNGTGTFDFNPDYTQSGAIDVTFYATDDSAAVDSEVVTITVN
ncbi:MAG: hypothetical protein JSU65_13420, partial [Candidatus Zixiibacteriota bacterium]